MLGLRYGISFHIEFDIFDLNADGIEDKNFPFVNFFGFIGFLIFFNRFECFSFSCLSVYSILLFQYLLRVSCTTTGRKADTHHCVGCSHILHCLHDLLQWYNFTSGRSSFNCFARILSLWQDPQCPVKSYLVSVIIVPKSYFTHLYTFSNVFIPTLIYLAL